jgi:hypothetical protein
MRKLNSKGKEVKPMKAFYEKLQKAGHSRDERIAKLAKVCQMD